MAEKRHPILAREGWIDIVVIGLAAIGIHSLLGFWWALPFWVMLAFVVQFFRDPVRILPDVPGVVCPADGRVIKCDEVDDPYLNRRARRISIFMNVFNVHANRSPVGGTIKEQWYHPGQFFNAALDKAAEQNERNALHIHTKDGQDVVVVQVAGLVARRILCYKQPGEEIARGERYGFIRYGSRIDVYLPLDCTPSVAIGDKVSSGAQLIATFAS